MFRSKTVLVIGAGAGVDANIPTGEKLKTLIRSLLSFQFGDFGKRVKGDYEVFRAFEELHENYPEGPSPNDYVSASQFIASAIHQTKSIDNFIEQHKSNPVIATCAKLAIVKAILDSETSSPIYIDHRRPHERPNLVNMEKTWFNRFFQLFTEASSVAEVLDRARQLCLVIFNYDRCVENFIFHSLQNLYGITAEVASEIVRAIEIYHPYGKAGGLPWQNEEVTQAFGKAPNSQDLLRLGKEIRTFTEGTSERQSNIRSLRRAMAESKTIVFIGFAFHPLNMKLLKPEAEQLAQREQVQYFATALYESDAAVVEIQKMLKAISGEAVVESQIRNDLDCSGLFSQYEKSLSLNDMV